ncbi:hypothetical protein C7212DRAFT_347274 [Tuber magnatum]|uniref:Uncharacterized protein n=1 Tax=Tuber magnatum TaxID=42249 RepID=A0A317SFY8_9PEZI|nr:hypothetical protein C7212DRAFT_347274 [Tuber magnatum]
MCLPFRAWIQGALAFMSMFSSPLVALFVGLGLALMLILCGYFKPTKSTFPPALQSREFATRFSQLTMAQVLEVITPQILQSHKIASWCAKMAVKEIGQVQTAPAAHPLGEEFHEVHVAASSHTVAERVHQDHSASPTYLVCTKEAYEIHTSLPTCSPSEGVPVVHVSAPSHPLADEAHGIQAAPPTYTIPTKEAYKVHVATPTHHLAEGVHHVHTGAPTFPNLRLKERISHCVKAAVAEILVASGHAPTSSPMQMAEIAIRCAKAVVNVALELRAKERPAEDGGSVPPVAVAHGDFVVAGGAAAVADAGGNGDAGKFTMEAGLLCWLGQGRIDGVGHRCMLPAVPPADYPFVWGPQHAGRLV